MITKEKIEAVGLNIRELAEEIGESRWWLWVKLQSPKGCESKKLRALLLARGRELRDLRANSIDELSRAIKRAGIKKNVIADRSGLSHGWLCTVIKHSIPRKELIPRIQKAVNSIGSDIIEISRC